MSGRVCVFGPSPLLTVAVEREGDEERIHLHAGGQGVWVARMIRELGAEPRLVGGFGGETGQVARLLAETEELGVEAVELAQSSSAYVHDRRGGERRVVAEARYPTFDRHELDALYSATLAVALDAGVCVLTGVPAADVLPVDTYRRLAGDLRANGVTVVADLSGEQLDAALQGGIASLKVSHEELHADGVVADADDLDALLGAARQLRGAGANEVVISRAAEPTIASIGDELRLVSAPVMEVVDHRGAGDSMTAALAVAATRGLGREDAVRLAVAAGQLNVTHHGFATGHDEAIRQLALRVELADPSGNGSARV
ncbi:MAG TPA: PfkB family carbohydrate kinase [Acidimicrobiia bacterium]|nr:PfkB family carbohydrate kinase [Acidimicrobiia bacterium]